MHNYSANILNSPIKREHQRMLLTVDHAVSEKTRAVITPDASQAEHAQCHRPRL